MKDMNIQFDTEIANKPAAFLAHKISGSLSRYETRLNRITVHLAVRKGEKKDENHKTCTLEARPIGLEPVVVSSQGPTGEQAVNCAIIKLKAALETALGRLNHH